MKTRRKNPVSVQTALNLATLGALGIAGYFTYSWLKKNPGALNPASDKNLAYQGANSIVQAITGNKIDSIGTSVANVFPSAAEKAVAEMLKPAPLTLKNVVSPIGPAPYEKTVTDTPEPFMFGLGGIGASRIRVFKSKRR